MPAESPIATRIRTALAQHLKRDASKIHPEDDLREDLGLDSLAMIELLFKIEEAFDLEIPNDDLSKITTVGDVVAYVEARVGSPASATSPAVTGAKGPAAGVGLSAARPAVKGGPKRPGAAVKVGKRPPAKKKGSRRA